MDRQQRAVKEFHELIGAPVGSRPMVPSPGRRELRLKLILEELLELAEASNFILAEADEIADSHFYFINEDTYRGQPDLVAVADALGDLLVVVNGAGLEWGIDLEPVFNEIHRSNMTKGGGALRGDGKALKGPLYQPPVLEPIIQQQMARDEWDDYPENWDLTDVRHISLKDVFWYKRDPDGVMRQRHLDAIGGEEAKISFTVQREAHSSFQRDPGDESDVA